MSSGRFDPLVLGQWVKYHRKEAAMTLADLGAAVGRPAPYLSQLENGRIEPKVGLLDDLAEALGCTPSDLLDDEAPTRRAHLEIEIERAQGDPRYEALGLGHLRPSAKVPDDVLEHVVALYQALPASGHDAEGLRRQRAGDRARLANIELRYEMRTRNNYFPEIEELATGSLAAVGYPGHGPVSERLLTDLAAHFGFTIERVKGMPGSARSITDQRARVIYIPQRDDLAIRAARSVVLQTLGHFALDHTETHDFADYLRQRVESNYFSAALLAPEEPALAFLQEAHAGADISIEDLKEQFYISYEMAAHRFTNLATVHFGIPTHFLRTDPDGVITKAYENDGIPFPTDADGALEGERVSRQWGARQAWGASDSFLLHYQHTTTDRGDYWCVTYVETATERTPHAITLGTSAAHAAVFRGSDTLKRVNARLADNHPDPTLIDRWDGVAWPSAAERSYVLSALPPSSRPFTPYPGVDMIDVYRFLDRQSRNRR